MKNFIKWSSIAFLSALTFVGCSSDADDVLGSDPETTVEVATIRLTEGGAADDIFFAEALGEANGIVPGRVIFTATEGTQRRLYITETLPGGSAEPFLIEELSNRATKADNSIDLDGDTTDTLDFTFDLNVPSSIEDGTIVYNFWTTTGRGDFTDTSKRLLIGVGTIEVKVGTGNNPDAAVRSFNGVTILEAPLGDGSSDTFLSLLDGETYTINEGSEVAALWDFGYYYGNTGLASFASANDYPTAVFDILPVANENTASGDEMIERDDLNIMYFALSSRTVADFDAITTSGELEDIVQSTNQRINQLQIGDIVEFVDNSGVKGLIRVNNITGTNGSTGSITFDIKVQNYTPIIN